MKDIYILCKTKPTKTGIYTSVFYSYKRKGLRYLIRLIYSKIKYKEIDIIEN